MKKNRNELRNFIENYLFGVTESAGVVGTDSRADERHARHVELTVKRIGNRHIDRQTIRMQVFRIQVLASGRVTAHRSHPFI